MANVRNILKKMGASLATTSFDKGYREAFEDMKKRIIKQKENINLRYIEFVLEKLDEE